MNKNLALTFIFFFVPLTFLTAQVNRNTLISLNWEKVLIEQDQLDILADSIRSKLSRVESILVNEYSGELLDNPSIVEYSLENEYDSCLMVTITGSMDKLLVSWEIFDSVFNKIVYQSSFEGAIDDDYTNILGGFWHPLVLSLKESLFSFASKVSIQVKALPGSKVFGLTEEHLTIDESGVVEARLDAYSNCSIAVSMSGYFTEYSEFLVNEANSTIYIEQKKKFNVEFEAGFYDLTYLRLGIRYYFIPDTAYLSLSTTIFQAQLLINNPSSDTYDPDIKLPNLNSLTLGIGGAIDLSHIKLRIPMGVEFFLRMSSDSSNSLDPIATWGMEIPIALEYSVHKNVALYFEYSPLFYFISDETQFRIYTSEGWKPFIIGSDFAVDLLHVNVGLRVRI